MPRAYELYLQDIVKATRFIEKQVAGLDYDAFIADEVRLYAILHNFTIIGEAIKQIPADIRQKNPEVPWREIAGARDVIVHGYFTVNFSIIWHAATKELPQLRQQVEAILADLNTP